MTPDGAGFYFTYNECPDPTPHCVVTETRVGWYTAHDISPLDNGPSKSGRDSGETGSRPSRETLKEVSRLEMEEYIGNLVSWGWHEGMKAEAERLAKRIEESRKPVEDPRIEVVRHWRKHCVYNVADDAIKDLLSRLDSVKEKS